MVNNCLSYVQQLFIRCLTTVYHMVNNTRAWERIGSRHRPVRRVSERPTTHKDTKSSLKARILGLLLRKITRTGIFCFQYDSCTCSVLALYTACTCSLPGLYLLHTPSMTAPYPLQAIGHGAGADLTSGIRRIGTPANFACGHPVM